MGQRRRRGDSRNLREIRARRDAERCTGMQRSSATGMDLTSVSGGEIVAAVGIPTALGLAVAFGALTAAVVSRQSSVDRFDERIMKALARRRTDRLDLVVAPLSMLA